MQTYVDRNNDLSPIEEILPNITCNAADYDFLDNFDNSNNVHPCFNTSVEHDVSNAVFFS